MSGSGIVNPELNRPSRGVALVTGSSSGIGASVAIDLFTIGFTVILTGRNSDKLAEVEKKCHEALESKGIAGDVIPYKIDFENAVQVDKLVDFIRSRYSKLTLLVNNVCWRGDIKNVLADDICHDLTRALKMNVLLPMRLILDCLVNCTSSEQSSSIVINVSSIAAQVTVPLHAYSISKACLSELSRQIALLGEKSRILSVTVSPGPVLTDERPHHAEMSRWTLMDRVATTQEISNLVTFLIDRPHLFNGQEINIDGGYVAKQRQK